MEKLTFTEDQIWNFAYEACLNMRILTGGGGFEETPRISEWRRGHIKLLLSALPEQYTHSTCDRTITNPCTAASFCPLRDTETPLPTAKPDPEKIKELLRSPEETDKETDEQTDENNDEKLYTLYIQRSR